MTKESDSLVVDPELEIPGAVLDADEGQGESQTNPVPAGIKYGLPAFGLVVLLIGYVVYLTFAQPSPEEELVFEQDEIADIARQEPPRLPPPVPDRYLVDKELIDSLNAKVQTLEKRLHDSSSQVSEQRQAVIHQSDSFQQVLTRLEANAQSMAELTVAINDLRARLDVIEDSVDNNNQRIHLLTRQRKRQPRVRPAFNLLSIDQWGGRDSVVLEMQDTTTMAAVGDIRAGWTIQSINRPNCIDVVRLSDKAKAKVCRKSNS